MICDYCKRWAATSRKQHKNRLANIDYNQAAIVFACPQCGGGEWATTEAFIQDAPSLMRRVWMTIAGATAR